MTKPLSSSASDEPSDEERTISLTPEDQLALWNALNEMPELTDAQRRLGAVMRGET